ncbi:23S rRNA (guanosine(2251)-2'-O)-methyltransferase RlmB [Citroniella saccharovorans]|uniref:23S rRNA (guanosine(2251)-2'-O)-methyltransferase RlmB n=1 Tax=Citroniella saccharovorans TaxID=2053367 RepID=UPI0036214DBC
MGEYIFGRNPVIELLEQEGKIRKIFLEDKKLEGSALKIIAIAKDKNIRIEKVNRKFLDKISDGQNHQGVGAEVENYKYYSLEEIIDSGAKRLVILDRIEDPHNLGAIIRTAEAAGFDGVVIQKRRSASVTPVAVKASSGATSYMKVAEVTNLTRSIEYLKENGFWIYGTDGRAEKYYTEVKYDGKVCIVIGNEGRGVSELIKKNCDFLVKIPMLGKIESLNASSAAAVIIYEVVRQNA